jgi:hypothetical protein
MVLLQGLLFLINGSSFCSQVNYSMVNNLQARIEAVEKFLQQELKKGTRVVDIHSKLKVLSENTQEYKNAQEARRKEKEYFVKAKNNNCVDDLSILSPIHVQWKKTSQCETMKKEYEQLEHDADELRVVYTKTPEYWMCDRTKIKGGYDPRTMSVAEAQRRRSEMVDYMTMVLDSLDNRRNEEQM